MLAIVRIAENISFGTVRFSHAAYLNFALPSLNSTSSLLLQTTSLHYLQLLSAFLLMLKIRLSLAKMRAYKLLARIVSTNARCRLRCRCLYVRT